MDPVSGVIKFYFFVECMIDGIAHGKKVTLLTIREYDTPDAMLTRMKSTTAALRAENPALPPIHGELTMKAYR